MICYPFDVKKTFLNFSNQNRKKQYRTETQSSRRSEEARTPVTSQRRRFFTLRSGVWGGNQRSYQWTLWSSWQLYTQQRMSSKYPCPYPHGEWTGNNRMSISANWNRRLLIYVIISHLHTGICNDRCLMYMVKLKRPSISGAPSHSLYYLHNGN